MPGVAPSKFIFGLTAPYRSAPSDTLLPDDINQWDDPMRVPFDLRVVHFFLNPMPQKIQPFGINPNSYGENKKR